MAKPLVAALAVLLALQAWAQPAPGNPSEAKAELTRGFAKGDDVSALDMSGQDESLVKLFEQAKYVQQGREAKDEQETYVAFIRSVARRLGTRADLAVELYRNRTRQARVAPAGRAELDARAAVALDVKRNPGISEAKKKRVARDLQATSEYLKKGLDGDASAIAPPERRRAEPERANELIVTFPDKPVADDGAVYDENGARVWSRMPPRAQPYPNASHPTPSPATTPGALSSLPSALNRAVYSLAQLSSFIDVKRGAEVAYEAVANVMEEGKLAVHRCYNFVKRALIDAGVIDAPNAQSTAVVGLRPDQASMFNQDVARHPEILDRLGYRRAQMGGLSDDPSEIPSGTIFIYGAQCAFAKYKSAGHAELAVSRAEYEKTRREKPRFGIRPLDADDVPACHYTCAGRSMAFLRTYGKGDKACLRMYVPVKSS